MGGLERPGVSLSLSLSSPEGQGGGQGGGSLHVSRVLVTLSSTSSLASVAAMAERAEPVRHVDGFAGSNMIDLRSGRGRTEESSIASKDGSEPAQALRGAAPWQEKKHHWGDLFTSFRRVGCEARTAWE